MTALVDRVHAAGVPASVARPGRSAAGAVGPDRPGARHRGGLYGPLLVRATERTAQLDDDDLAVITAFLTGATELQVEAAARVHRDRGS